MNESSYNRLYPPKHSTLDVGSRATNISFRVEITSINDIKLDKRKIDLSYNMMFTWKENRISFFNIPEQGSEQNEIKSLIHQNPNLFNIFAK